MLNYSSSQLSRDARSRRPPQKRRKRNSTSNKRLSAERNRPTAAWWLTAPKFSRKPVKKRNNKLFILRQQKIYCYLSVVFCFPIDLLVFFWLIASIESYSTEKARILKCFDYTIWCTDWTCRDDPFTINFYLNSIKRSVATLVYFEVIRKFELNRLELGYPAIKFFNLANVFKILTGLQPKTVFTTLTWIAFNIVSGNFPISPKIHHECHIFRQWQIREVGCLRVVLHNHAYTIYILAQVFFFLEGNKPLSDTVSQSSQVHNPGK